MQKICTLLIAVAFIGCKEDEEPDIGRYAKVNAHSAWHGNFAGTEISGTESLDKIDLPDAGRVCVTLTTEWNPVTVTIYPSGVRGTASLENHRQVIICDE